jgi:hypothetical protein
MATPVTVSLPGPVRGEVILTGTGNSVQQFGQEFIAAILRKPTGNAEQQA